MIQDVSLRPYHWGLMAAARRTWLKSAIGVLRGRYYVPVGVHDVPRVFYLHQAFDEFPNLNNHQATPLTLDAHPPDDPGPRRQDTGHIDCQPRYRPLTCIPRRHAPTSPPLVASQPPPDSGSRCHHWYGKHRSQQGLNGMFCSRGFPSCRHRQMRP